MPLVHVTARAYRLPLLLTDFDVARWFWSRLRCAFPNALAAVLMPNHPHVVTPAASVEQAQDAMRAVIGGLRRSGCAGASIRWESVPRPQVVPGPKHALRQIRYVALNPSRAGLVDDPLCWFWSTHRDVVGGVDDSWVSGGRLAEALGHSRPGFAERHHRYVSSDPSVLVTGTPAPRRAPPTEFAVYPLADILAAAAAATRAHPLDVRRRGATRRVFIRLARQQGWHDARLIARVCAMTPTAVRLHFRRPLPDLHAASLCLGDSRLLAAGRVHLSPDESSTRHRPPMPLPTFV